MPEAAVEALPGGWQRVGDVLLLRLPDALEPHEAQVAEVYADVLDARAVLQVEGAEGELREPRTRHLFGDEDTETTHREDGLAFRLDPAEVLFSAGNHHERHRLTDQVEPGERVVDLFAGIGYFTLPLARAGAEVVACEKNPPSAAYLRQNATLNDLADWVEVREGDAREVAPTGVADRVLMGVFPGTRAFVPTALAALAPEGGTLHYHTTAPEPDACQAAWRELATHPRLVEAPVEAELVQARRVKSYAPNVAHVVLDVRAVPEGSP